ncbi:uncharacterized protein LOC112045612 [Bicyclus anynana]|uniref:Uncharacterized protein LOC112045612 n=1 Tax=Bicyclus anynana TaxID=110368 RepID=A0ABM3LW25_BICAN|nr:uncharacterized protein LOC112045612 [Bicyclus anynana]
MNNYEDTDPTDTKKSEYQEFEPVTIYSKNLDNITAKNINCDDFSSYAVDCRIDAALIYNSTRRTPPSPAKIYHWCRAIKHLTNCAIDWNADCKVVTDTLFNEESIKGHMHVVNSICDDEWFLIRYSDTEECIHNTADAWENCYFIFKHAIEDEKNTSYEWTHYEVHFNLCCARASFRRCTLESLFAFNTGCNYYQSSILQKYSVIVSEGDVYQDCDRDMMYKNCPGGDPRPSVTRLSHLMNSSRRTSATVGWHGHCLRIPMFVQAIFFLLIYF